ncbi:hypothetical protein TRFO_32480 [Tritrichomonas foetus]|uniref:KANL2-like probable zinc-finger domain-containing protein n=1 Tax=Tritrichomonas foetus TaxID=1144522 RepID=A0A1J4JNT9_9EUKA|nr:hypothetical protein TRFO_32480 [Tritrichomonas foetus]|eukprot:OHT00715.1 hypothetical protein TRFO_32480 [Tritrichomonas foetus]
METDFDKVLIILGCSKDSLQQKERFHRSDDPPKDVVMQIARIVSTKSNPINDTNPFHFNTSTSVTMARTEFTNIFKNHTKDLLEYYQAQLAQIDIIASANIIAASRADAIMTRRHFYFCVLTAILNTPKKVAFAQMEQLITLRKLFMNQKLKNNNDQLQFSEQCCREPNCPQIAIFGSSYCGWHILKDSAQTLFVKCPTCGWPRLISDFIPCRGHKDKPRPSRKH